jgi:hypothetical protein
MGLVHAMSSDGMYLLLQLGELLLELSLQLNSDVLLRRNFSIMNGLCLWVWWLMTGFWVGEVAML